MKSYRPARQLLAKIDRVLAADLSLGHSAPLDEVVEIMHRGRHYTWVGIYLAVAEHNEPQALRGLAPAEGGATDTPGIFVPIKVGKHVLGVLGAQKDDEYAFGGQERVLLKGVADQLARFLTGRGKYIVRKAREAAAGSDTQPHPSAVQSARQKKSAAA